MSIHSLRHTFVSLMAAQGIRLEVIAEWIGDHPVTVMQVYLHVFKLDTAMLELQLPGITGRAKEKVRSFQVESD